MQYYKVPSHDWNDGFGNLPLLLGLIAVHVSSLISFYSVIKKT